MTKGEIAKRMSVTIGTGVLLYVASYGPVVAYAENRNDNLMSKMRGIYSPIIDLCEENSDVGVMFDKYVNACAWFFPPEVSK